MRLKLLPSDSKDQPDLLYDLLPYRPKLAIWPGLLIAFVGVACFIRCIFHRERLFMIRRGLFVYSICVTLRATTSATTTYHDPSAACITYVAPTTALEFFVATLFPVNGVTCGDLMFSGHTLMFVSTAWVWTWYCSIYESLFAWAASGAGMYTLIGFRLHYTDDVIIAFYVNTAIFLLYHTILSSSATSSKLFKVIKFFEADRLEGLESEDNNVNSYDVNQYNTWDQIPELETEKSPLVSP